MPTGLRRFQSHGDGHFITFSCFRHRQLLGSPEARHRFVEILEEARQKYRFRVFGYVVMPDHVHLLVSEPEEGKLSTAIQVIKQRFSRWCPGEEAVWETRYYDFNLFSSGKIIEKLRYIHRNPVRRELVETPEAWDWSSYRFYATGVQALIQVTRAEL